MKFIIIFNLMAITTINPIINAHENHDHQIYNWSNHKNKTTKTDKILNRKKSEDTKNKTTNNNTSDWIKFLDDQ